MGKTDIILVGGGGHCRSCIDVIECEKRFQILGIVEKVAGVCRSNVLGYPVLGLDEDLPQLRQMAQNALVSLGQIKTPEVRARLFRMLQDIGFKLPVIISPLAYVSKHATIGTGTIVMHGAIVNASATVGDNCIINSNALIEHEVTIENNCHISTGAMLNGGAVIASQSLVGSGVVVKENISIGRRCVVGAGATVVKDLVDNKIYF